MDAVNHGGAKVISRADRADDPARRDRLVGNPQGLFVRPGPQRPFRSVNDDGPLHAGRDQGRDRFPQPIVEKLAFEASWGGFTY